MNWLTKLISGKAEVEQPPEHPVMPDLATATLDELEAYNRAQDARIQYIQRARALVAKRIDQLLTGN